MLIDFHYFLTEGTLCCIRSFSQCPLPREVIDNFSRGFGPDKRRQFFHGGDGNLLYRSKMSQQSSLSFGPHAGNRRQFGSEVAQLASLAMISDRVSMRLVANHLNQTQNQRM